MKTKNTYLLLTAVILLLCASLASCSQDNFAADQDDALPPGCYPLKFVASMEGMTSRASSKDIWFEDDTIGVRLINRNGKKHNIIGCYQLNSEGTVKEAVGRYSVDDNYNKTFLDSIPMEWPYTNGTVTAWFPFEPQIDIPIGNQSKGIYKYDYLSAVAEGKRYTDVIDLQFRHQMAKVSCRVVPGDGITEDEFKTLWLRLQGYTTCSFKERELTGANEGWIIPDSVADSKEAVYEALLVPNEMKDKDLINIGLQTNYEGNIIPKDFSYPSPKIEAGKHYIYNIIVKKDRIEVTFFTVEWKDEGDGQHLATPYTFRVNLSENLIREINVWDSHAGDYVINSELFEIIGDVTPIKNEDTKLYDKFEVLGNEFTINIAVTTATRSTNLVVVDKEAVNNVQVVSQRGSDNKKRVYKENKVFLIADETTLDFKSELNVGDYFFNDGSWSSNLGWEDVHCVGIVFAVNKGDDLSVFKLTGSNGEYVADKAADYIYKSDLDRPINPIYASKRIRGYVLALENATRWDVVKEYEKDSLYKGGTLKEDVTVVVGSDTTVYKKGTVYNDWKLPENLKVIKQVVQFPWTHLSGQAAALGSVCSLSPDDFSGFANMESVKGYIGKRLEEGEVPEYETLEALAAAENYEDIVKAPEGTSGWYFPSIKQLQTALEYLYTFDNRADSPIRNAKGTPPAGVYWSSTITYFASQMKPGSKAYAYEYGNSDTPIIASHIVGSVIHNVRAVLTF